eukprot:15000660-Alexandrium_andersonii.AAC.1
MSAQRASFTLACPRSSAALENNPVAASSLRSSSGVLRGTPRQPLERSAKSRPRHGRAAPIGPQQTL